MFCLLLLVNPIFAQWYATADFSGCPGKYFQNSSGKDGPFQTQSQCTEFIDRARQSNNMSCAKYKCEKESSGSSQTTYNPSTPSYAEIEAEKKRAEAEKLATEKKKEVEEAEAERIKEKDAALKRMKGGSSSNLGLNGSSNNGTLKGTGSDAFGIKTVKETGIQSKETDKETRSIETAWKQLYCAKDIMQYMTTHLEKIGTGSFCVSDLDEIKYLSMEVNNALNGTQKGVQCNTNNIPATPGDQLKIDKKKETVSRNSKTIVAIGEKYLKADTQVKSLQNEFIGLDKKEKELKEKMIVFKGTDKEKEELSKDFQETTAEKGKKQGELNIALLKKKEVVKEYNSFHVTMGDPEDEQPAKKPPTGKK